MAGKPRPPDCYLNEKQPLSRTGEKIWRDSDGSRYYTWDSLHGEIEVYDSRGRHLGALDAVNGKLIKGPVKGRRLSGV